MAKMSYKDMNLYINCKQIRLEDIDCDALIDELGKMSASMNGTFVGNVFPKFTMPRKPYSPFDPYDDNPYVEEAPASPPDPNSPYAILGIPSSASADDIKSAWRRMAKNYHPDLNPSTPSSTEMFMRVQDAYKVLSDPQQRRKYDAAVKLLEKRTKPKENERGGGMTNHPAYGGGYGNSASASINFWSMGAGAMMPN